MLDYQVLLMLKVVLMLVFI